MGRLQGGLAVYDRGFPVDRADRVVVGCLIVGTGFVIDLAHVFRLGGQTKRSAVGIVLHPRHLYRTLVFEILEIPLVGRRECCRVVVGVVGNTFRLDGDGFHDFVFHTGLYTGEVGGEFIVFSQHIVDGIGRSSALVGVEHVSCSRRDGCRIGNIFIGACCVQHTA